MPRGTRAFWDHDLSGTSGLAKSLFVTQRKAVPAPRFNPAEAGPEGLRRWASPAAAPARSLAAGSGKGLFQRLDVALHDRQEVALLRAIGAGGDDQALQALCLEGGDVRIAGLLC